VVDGPLLVVRGRGQRLPKIPAHVEVVDDGNGCDTSRTIRVAILSGTAAAAGLVLSSPLIAMLNGETVGLDGDIPLVAGDTVAFRCPDAGG
jgi:hypothetical protein